jgi:hypothetical protein
VEERRVIFKRHGGLFAAVYFVFMMACYVGVSAITPPIRHQMASIHSPFWTFGLPWAAGCCAIISLALWFVASLLEKRQRAKAQ